MFSAALRTSAEELLADARAKGLKIVTAESCTGGLIAGLLTEISGSSDVLDRGFVTYSNKAKEEMLGVPAALLRQHGAVSEAVVRVMAEGAIRNSTAQLSIAVTGIAGPGGGSDKKPVGLVHIAAARRSVGQAERGEAVRLRDHEKVEATLHRECRFGDIGRDKVRLKSVQTALELLRELL
jgi:nicotinamide-nucleotide amidase